MDSIARLVFDLQALGYRAEIIGDIGTSTGRGSLFKLVDDDGHEWTIAVTVVEPEPERYDGPPASLYMRDRDREDFHSDDAIGPVDVEPYFPDA